MKMWARVRETTLNLLRQGVTPERISASLVLGALIGVIPVLGVTTLLCTMVALLFRLNLVAIQAANWLVYPGQLALLYPFYLIGARLFQSPMPSLHPSELAELFSAGFLHAIRTLWDATLYAVVAWFLLSAVVGPIAYVVLKITLRRLWRRQPVSEAIA